MSDPEVCICAAIRLPDGKVIRGHRHCHCLATAHYMGFADKDVRASAQGFVTSRGRFVSREVGRELQDAAGVASIAPDGYRGAILYSEDLY